VAGAQGGAVMGFQLALAQDVEDVTCGNCGITFWVPITFYRQKLKDKTNWHCPNGHARHFVSESPEERLKRQLAAKEEELRLERDRVARGERQLSAARGRVTRIKNRVQHGVCPCCNRTFQNLLRHMATKHPDWKDQEITHG
jgi:hypothetical protein